MDYIDEVIAIIRGSQTSEEARQGLISRFSLSEKQASAILEMRLRRLTGMERDEIIAELEAVRAEILNNRMHTLKD